MKVLGRVGASNRRRNGFLVLGPRRFGERRGGTHRGRPRHGVRSVALACRPRLNERAHPPGTDLVLFRILGNGNEVIGRIGSLGHIVAKGGKVGNRLSGRAIIEDGALCKENHPVELAENVPAGLMYSHETCEIAGLDNGGDVGNEPASGKGIEAGSGFVEEEKGNVADQLLLGSRS